MKLRRTLALMVALGGLAGTALTVNTVSAQTKPKDDKKPAAKADDKKAAGKVEIYEGKKGWRYRVVNGEDKTIAMATKSYEKKEDVLKELDTIKTILNTSKPVEVKE